MKKERDFVSMITKLTEDFEKHKRHCFKFGSKSLTKKLLGMMEEIQDQMKMSISVIHDELKSSNAESIGRLWAEKVAALLESEKCFSEGDYLKLLRINYRDLRKLVREYARTKLSYSTNLDYVIELLPEYAELTPKFPQHLAFLGILKSKEDFLGNEPVPILIEYYKQKLQTLLEHKRYIDEIFKAKLNAFILVQRASLEEALQNFEFLSDNSIDDASTIMRLGKFCKRGYLDTVD